MAVGKGIKTALPQYDDSGCSGYLSDESDFYGDEATVKDLSYRAAAFSPDEWWANKTPSLTEIANAGLSGKPKEATATLYNPYQGRRYADCARQLEESVEDFLARLPPATTRVSSTTPYVPWIYIANPYRKAPALRQGENVEKELEEGPPVENRDLKKFETMGKSLLEELSGIKHAIEERKAGQSKASITKAVNVEKERIIRKWMMFCPPQEVNAVWSVVARATAQNDLGIVAKVAPDNGRGDVRLICIYTKDFNDIEDVTRVLGKMKNIGLFESKDVLYYKCDAYTYLNLTSKNPYNIKASLYNSKDILAGKAGSKGQNKLDELLYKRKEHNGDWRELDRW
ncbi:hypothetical protein D0Z07_6932 [Hyphodiscus hymeniophilus]|uniref:DUF1917-domain-containing protein n=1 Tax=Hyphodiscus hymeniophilus TaxID=353542 RepID=A0A9P6VFZ9_9HELO|nr:hypothetical protein D0Z07_6932 [Hyphodiscus hymeniophilus]